MSAGRPIDAKAFWTAMGARAIGIAIVTAVQDGMPAGFTGAPILRDCMGAIDCQLEETVERHGVVIAIGRVATPRWHR